MLRTKAARKDCVPTLGQARRAGKVQEREGRRKVGNQSLDSTNMMFGLQVRFVACVGLQAKACKHTGDVALSDSTTTMPQSPSPLGRLVKWSRAQRRRTDH